MLLHVLLGLPIAVVGQQPTGAPLSTSGTVDVLVLGSLHLRQIDREAGPVFTELIRQSLQKYQPDHVAVEWLHPSIDAATTFNYRPLGDRETLGRLWGLDRRAAKAALETTQLLLDRHKQLDAQSRVLADVRVELGKWHYLSGDQLNAGYQWWQAGQLGADVRDLKRLTSNNFAGHELEVFGFEIARAQALEYITPFDYQGPEAGSDVWGLLLRQLRALALRRKHGVTESDATWKELSSRFDMERTAFEEKNDRRWVQQYGDIKEIAEYAAAWDGFRWAAAQAPVARDGLSRMRWLQSPEYEAVERRVQTELIPGISIGGLGRARLNGIARRNERMVGFVEADIRRLGRKRVLIIVGAGHKFFLEDLLRVRGYRIIPSSDFMP